MCSSGCRLLNGNRGGLSGFLDAKVHIPYPLTLSDPLRSLQVVTHNWSDAVASGSAFATVVFRQTVCEDPIRILISKFTVVIVVEELFLCTQERVVEC